MSLRAHQAARRTLSPQLLQQRVCLSLLALLLPQPTEAYGDPQFERLRLLAAGYRQGVLKTRLGMLSSGGRLTVVLVHVRRTIEGQGDTLGVGRPAPVRGPPGFWSEPAPDSPASWMPPNLMLTYHTGPARVIGHFCRPLSAISGGGKRRTARSMKTV